MAKRSNPRSSTVDNSGATPELLLFSLPGIPEIHAGRDLVKCVIDAARRAAIRFENGDILVIAQKIVSKAEGAVVRLKTVRPSPQARSLAARLKKDPRAIQVVLNESRRIVRSDHVLITETHHGFVCANAGVDHSNVLGSDVVTLLPRHPDRSAKKFAAAADLLMEKIKGSPAVLIRGYRYNPRSEPATRIIRPPAEDLFR